MATARHGMRAAVTIVIFAAVIAACSPNVLPLPSPTPVAARPLTPDHVERRLQVLDPALTLRHPTLPDDVGVYPDLAFQATTQAADGVGTSMRLVFVYPNVTERIAAQPMFQWNSIQGPTSTVTWDGEFHSEWVGVHNVIVEVVLPGGSFGGGPPTPEEAAYPGRVRAALDLSP